MQAIYISLPEHKEINLLALESTVYVLGIPNRSLSSEKPVNVQAGLLWLRQILNMYCI